MTKEATGSCLCGKITLKAKQMNTSLGACHCATCRKWTGGPFLAVDCGSDVNVQGQEFLSVYNSSDWGERAFCKSCGTILFFRLKDHSFYSVSAELFNEPELKFETQIFIDSKPNYYDFANSTKKMTGEEVFAAFAPKS